MGRNLENVLFEISSVQYGAATIDSSRRVRFVFLTLRPLCLDDYRQTLGIPTPFERAKSQKVEGWLRRANGCNPVGIV